MNRQELIEKIAEKTNNEAKVVEKIVGAFMQTVKETVASGDNVQLVGFGTFDSRDRAARVGHNPHTGETINIPATKVPAFKPGKGFKAAVK